MSREVELKATLEELPVIAEAIAKRLPKHAVIFLRGDLAAGKTTLVAALADRLGVSSAVTSPTFSIQQIYGDGLYHYDLYQCPTEKFMALGLFEALQEPGWHLIEWGEERLEEIVREYGFFTASVSITPCGEGRCYRMRTDA